MPGTPRSPKEERERMRVLRAEGRSRNAIARDLSPSVETATWHCGEICPSFDCFRAAGPWPLLERRPSPA